mgnify:CR=1 FL=1
MLREKTGLVIGILLIIILVLAGVLLYAFVAKPYVSGYFNNIYNQGANDALTVLINQIQARGYAEIPINNGQSLILVLAQPQNSASAQTSEILG